MAREEKFDFILVTKLHRPPVEENYVHRPHLLERLEQNRNRPLSLVSAPAGYGKSVLVSCWLASCDSPNVWVSLDENDNKLHVFSAYFVAAVEKLFPGACRNTHALLNAPNLPPVNALANSLLNELDRIDQSFIIALDDYYLINESAVHDLIAAILKHPPPSLHLVIVGRRDPPLPIIKLRAKSQVTELRSQDLRFTTAETVMFLERALEDQIDPSIAAAVEEKTEGWVTGIRLAALSMRHRGSLDPRLLEPQVDAQYVMEYLFDEVFAHQPPEISRYLLSTSVLDRFCGPLCEAVCVPGDEPYTCETGGWEFIAWLKKENIFLIRLDGENQWFRYHHLFQRLLVRQLKRHCNADEIKTIHSQAAAWFFENGLIEEGLRHSLAAGDIPKAMRMVARHGHDLMNDQQWPRLKRWIDLLPQNSVEQDPELIMFEAWHNHVHKAGHDLSAMATYLEKAKKLVDNLPEKDSLRAKQIKGHFDALRGFQSLIFADTENGQKYTQSACKNIPTHHKRARALARIFQAGAYQMAGDFETGLPVYFDEMQNIMREDRAYHAMYLVNLCFIYWLEADLFTMRKNAERSLKASMKYQMPEATASGLYFLGIACYVQNDLKTAEEQLATLVNDYYFINTGIYAHGAIALALVYLAKGEIGRAQKLLEKVMDYAIDTNNNEVHFIVQAFAAEYALRLGNLAEASNWANKFNAKPFLLPFLFYWPQVTLSKILMAQNTKDSRQQAADLLEQLSNFLTSIHNKSSQISVLALQALLLDSRGEKSAAIKKLTEAINLAEPGGIIRFFVNLGPQMADLLKQLIEQNVAVDYIGRILAAFKEDEDRAMQGESEHLSAQLQPSNAQTLTQPLTNRELQILNLLGQWLQNKEIAAKLFISPLTVKKHLDNIYGKLNISGRRQAVEKAQRLGILPPL